jgi:archaeal preflagellin peptidase FlaK
MFLIPCLVHNCLLTIDIGENIIIGKPKLKDDIMLNIPIMCTFMAILACFYAGYSDLKNGIIPNKLTFPLIALGVILNGIYAFIIGNLWYLILCLIYVIIIFILGYLLWKMGAWAGGDVKLFTALAALIPFYPALVSYTIYNVTFPIIAQWPFPLTLIINSLLSILPFLLIYVLFISMKNKPHLIGELFKPVRDYRKNIVLTLIVTSAIMLSFLITTYLPYQIIIVTLILIYLLTLVISKLPNRIKAVIISVVTVVALFQNLVLTLSGIIILFISITIIEIVKKLLTSVSREALQDDLEVQDLKEGMIPAYSMYQLDDAIYFDDKSFFNKFKEILKSGDVSKAVAPKGKLLIGSMAAGLTDDDVKLLKDLLDKDRIDYRFRIKKGVPFAPSIFIGLVISLFVGDLAFILQKILYSILY